MLCAFDRHLAICDRATFDCALERINGVVKLENVYATEATTEELRNFKRVDIDSLFRRQENRRWPFPKFADDVFKRRLRHAGHNSASLQEVFGNSMKPNEKAFVYGGTAHLKAIKVEKEWPDAVRNCLVALASVNLLSEKLGEAWVRQQLERKKPLLPHDDFLPWENSDKKWWKKERIDQALLQIAARRQQKMVWSGRKEILGLAAGNILAFVDLCQYIWAAWLRSLPGHDEFTPQPNEPPKIHDHAVQNEGIQQASSYWYRKIRNEQRGDSQLRFVTNLGNRFRKYLREDRKMSYPGFNGFSLPLQELDNDKWTAKFLRETEAYGVLVGAQHTSRTSSRGECKKWYLHPILCPHFQIPIARTKEPIEVHIHQVREWLVTARVFIPKGKTQLSLFDMGGAEN